MTIEVRWGSATHVGHVRQGNEDSVLAGPAVFAVADGMGGHAAGEVASALAIGALARLGGDATVEDIVRSVREANEIILSGAVSGSGREGMGTTVTGVCLGRSGEDDALVIFNVGDSRTYRMRAGVMTQLTDDHSLVAEMVLTGEISSEEATVHPSRNVVTRALGLEGPVEVDAWVEAPEAGTTYLICSDGLTDEVGPDAIATALLADGSPQALADALIGLALDAGAHDNVSAVVLRVEGIVTGPNDLEEDTHPRGVRVVTAAPGDGPPTPAPNLITEVPSSPTVGEPVAKRPELVSEVPSDGPVDGAVPGTG